MCGCCMPCHVGESECELTQTCVSGTETRCVDNLFYEFRRNGLAGLIVAGKSIEDLFFGEVVFIELRGEFHKVAVDVGSRQ